MEYGRMFESHLIPPHPLILPRANPRGEMNIRRRRREPSNWYCSRCQQPFGIQPDWSLEALWLLTVVCGPRMQVLYVCRIPTTATWVLATHQTGFCSSQRMWRCLHVRQPLRLRLCCLLLLGWTGSMMPPRRVVESSSVVVRYSWSQE